MLISVSLITFTAVAQPHAGRGKIDNNFHLYILMGQSNMSGRGEITEEYKNESNPRVLMLDKNNQWVQAQHPLHFDKSVAGVGPGLAFAIKMANKNPGIKIGVIPCAVGGTSIRVWKPGGYDSATKKYPFDAAVIRIKEAMKSGIIKGMLWHQGEADSKPEAAAQYLPQFKTLVERIRTLTHNATLPVVAGELGRYREQVEIFNEVLKKIPEFIPYTALATSEGLVDKGDHIHFNSPSSETLGERFAEKMEGLENKSVTYLGKWKKAKR